MKSVAVLITGFLLMMTAHAQTAKPNCEEKVAGPCESRVADDSGASRAGVNNTVLEYHSRVGRLVRETEARLHEITEQVAAGEISSERGQQLKLAATRAMLGRMETLLAVYDARLDSSAEHSTVNVKDLEPATGAASAAR